MPKMKTRKAAAKRYKKTGTGKIKRSRMHSNHFIGKSTRSPKRVRNIRKATLVSKADEKKVKVMLPY
ncbi:50S ribosomal protein L35 [Sporosalibacterium faouarense]|uniref:50S ribosomal protein L35 n=1 Tax=Sporosalibacterium faouarense TaxID=516123 RepID=UPI00141D211B|nr:50S ribosomal protein L35 [Sporosalibacterium faouarense]MTI49522.1 50S ribosomal protein L35 [Bacillota bacterium]